jgi:8-oxo-dGTP diphosphatase
MITLRNVVAAFLRHNGKYLLMKRADDRPIAPGFWSGVGGHMEPRELNDPLGACYREIEEETGIDKNNIGALELLYVIMRRNKDEIHQSYVYFGETAQTEVVQTSEGELHWVPENELTDRAYTKTFAAMLEHYTKREPGDRAVYVGVADGEDGELQMTWSRCEDFS